MPPIEEWLSFIHAAGFDLGWRDLGLVDGDLAKLQVQIVENPECGSVIAGTGGLRKLRLAPKGRGKSGGCRVCHAWYPAFGIVILAQVYGKGEKTDLVAAEKKSIFQMLRAIESELAKRNED